MYSDGAPEFIVDQGVYYPAPINYGYYYTGYETPGEWDGNHHFMDGQEVQYLGGQIENFPYQYYYTPGYDYTQPIYNPYDPYASGAVVGSDVPQVYATPPQYNDYVPPAPYYHTAVQPRPDLFMNPSPGNTTNGSLPSRIGAKQTLSSTSAPFTMVSPSPTLKHTHNMPEKSKESGIVQRQTHINERGSNGSAQVTNNIMSNGTAQPYDKQLKNTHPVGGALSNYRPGVYQTVGVNKSNPAFYGGGSVKNLTVPSNVPSDQTLAQPAKKLDHQLVVKSYTTKAGHSDTEGNIVILPDQYNKADFPVDYAIARFFVIKSYSEDDVHKSIKYNVWSSTPNGNKKLDKAYEDAQRVAEKDSQGCPVFLFFSVNASGNFCGVAEMMGRVDFHKDMDFWQQDKWSGSFPVKWHFIKDVPNVKFRHITLENNENNPVTYSRDTQEVMIKPGLEVLKIFKAHASRASLLDDFMYYESREKFMHEERAKQSSKRFGGPVFLPALDLPPPRKLNYVVNVPSAKDNQVINQKDMSSKDVSASPSTNQVTSTTEATVTSTSEIIKPSKGEPNGDLVASLKIGSLTISSEKARSSPTPTPSSLDPEATFTVGTMPVKINGLKKSATSRTSAGQPQDVRPQKVD
uniref:YTH domain-containing family protein n=1 Tax=Kalanchoe fedtschenkoi TaxID=63787 RepID=A0A7N0UJ65_KALFE